MTLVGFVALLEVNAAAVFSLDVLENVPELLNWRMGC